MPELTSKAGPADMNISPLQDLHHCSFPDLAQGLPRLSLQTGSTEPLAHSPKGQGHLLLEALVAVRRGASWSMQPSS